MCYVDIRNSFELDFDVAGGGMLTRLLSFFNIIERASESARKPSREIPFFERPSKKALSDAT